MFRQAERWSVCLAQGKGCRCCPFWDVKIQTNLYCYFWRQRSFWWVLCVRAVFMYPKVIKTTYHCQIFKKLDPYAFSTSKVFHCGENSPPPLISAVLSSLESILSWREVAVHCELCYAIKASSSGFDFCTFYFLDIWRWIPSKRVYEISSLPYCTQSIFTSKSVYLQRVDVYRDFFHLQICNADNACRWMQNGNLQIMSKMAIQLSEVFMSQNVLYRKRWSDFM